MSAVLAEKLYSPEEYLSLGRATEANDRSRKIPGKRKAGC